MYTAFQLLDKINSHISDIQFTRTPAGLYDPIKYVLSMGGKRIRPVLMLMAYNLYKEDVSSIYDPATAIEVYHNYTLLHDDLMDRADMRRGKTKYGMTILRFCQETLCWCWPISIWLPVHRNTSKK